MTGVQTCALPICEVLEAKLRKCVKKEKSSWTDAVDRSADRSTDAQYQADLYFM